MNRRASVPIIIPPTAPEPKVRFPFAPTPVETIIGNKPKTIVNAVIKIERKRTFAAPTAACVSDIPASLRLIAYSVIRIAVLANNPINIINPVCI